MSTYTDLHVRRKENLTILRMPGDPNDGITPQRVILANPENIYDGTFRGKVEVSSAEFNNVTLNNATIDGGVISNAMIYSGNQVIDIADLTSNTDEITSNIEALQQQMLFAQTSCENLDKKIDQKITDILTGDTSTAKVSADVIEKVQASIDEQLNTLSNSLTGLINDDITAVNGSIDVISGAVDDLKAADGELSGAIKVEIASRTDEDTKLSNKIADNKQEFDEFVSDKFDKHVEDFDKHAEENKRDFAELKEFFAEELKNKRHYKIVNKFEKVPYDVEDYAVNVIEAGLTDYKITYNQQVIGYGTKLKDGNIDKLKVSITTNDKIPALSNVIPGSYTATLEKGSGAAAGAFVNSEPVGGAYFYNIAWLDDTIQLDKVGDSYYAVKDTQYNTLIGRIVDAIVEDGKFTSGKMLFNAGGKYNVFYEAFPNGWSFNSIDQVSAYSPSQACSIQFNPDGRSFQFGFGVTTKLISEIKDADNAVFGKVLIDKTKKDMASAVSSIAVDGINLTKYGIYSIREPNATLDSSNGFSCRLDADLVLSAEVDQENAVFSVVKTKEKFKYPFYKPSTIEAAPDLSNATGFIVPDIENAKITDVGVLFSALSVQRVISGSLRTYVCLSVAENLWEYSEGDKSIPGSPWLTIHVINNIDTSWVVNTEGYSEDGQTYQSTYFVRPRQPQVIEETGTYSPIVTSSQTNVVHGEQRTYPEAEYTADVTGPTSAGGEPRIVFSLVSSNASDLLIRVPAAIGDQNNSYMREFIVAANIASEPGKKVDFKLVDADGDALAYYANGMTYMPAVAGSEPVSIAANTWTTIRVTQVDNGMFEVEDLGYNKLKEKLDSVDSAIAEEADIRKKADDKLSTVIDEHTETITELWKNIRGGLNYAGQLKVNGDSTHPQSIKDAIRISIEPVPEKLREGFFYVVSTDVKAKHYTLDGLEVEHGDWVIINKNCMLSTVTSADVSIFDAQDYDNVKLNDDNEITGKNTFTNTVTISSDGTLNVKGQTDFSAGLKVSAGNTSVQSLSVNDAFTAKQNAVFEKDITLSGKFTAKAKAQFNDDIHVEGNAEFDSSITAGSIKVADTFTVDTVSVELKKKAYAKAGFEADEVSALSLSTYNAKIDKAAITYAKIEDALFTNLSVDLSALKYNPISSLQDLSNDVYGKLNSHDSSIKDLDDQLSNGMRFFGTLSVGENETDIHNFFAANGFENEKLQPGYCFRIGVRRVAFGNGAMLCVLHENDYIVISKQSTTQLISLSDINIIRDAYAEGMSLSEQLSSISAVLDHNINGLSASLSNIVNTLSAIDKATDADIMTNNTLVTDVIGSPSGSHNHQKYYMTFLSGTIVFKPID